MASKGNNFFHKYLSIITLAIVLVGLPATYFAAISKIGEQTTTNQHAAGPNDTPNRIAGCTTWKQVGSGFKSFPGGNVQILTYGEYDNYTGQFCNYHADGTVTTTQNKGSSLLKAKISAGGTSAACSIGVSGIGTWHCQTGNVSASSCNGASTTAFGQTVSTGC